MLSINSIRSLLEGRGRYLSSKRYYSCPHSHQKIQDQLHKMNNLFLDTYAEKKKRIKESLGNTKPLVLSKGDDLILKYKGTTKVIRYVPERYHWVKSIAHNAGSIHALNWLILNQPEKTALWQREKDMLKEELMHLQHLISGNKDLQQYESLIVKYLNCLDHGNPISEVVEEISALIEEATVLRIDALHAVINSLREEIGPEYWKQLSVIVLGPRMPREGELNMQYYRAMGLSEVAQGCPHISGKKEDIGGKKLIYAESIEDEDKAIDLLVVELADEDLGEEIFEDGLRMHGDILRDAAKKHLQKLSNQSE